MRQVSASAIAAELGIDEADVDRAFVRLYEDGYVDGGDASAMGGRKVLVTEVTAKGRREVGM